MTRVAEAKIKWSDSVVATIKDMWKGGASCREIAVALGPDYSRNAVIGKVTRLKLPQRRKQPVRNTAKMPTIQRAHAGNPRGGLAFKIAAAKKARIENPDEPHPSIVDVIQAKVTVDEPILRSSVWEPLVGVTPIALADHREGQCRWPVGDPILYCGAAAEGRYCEAHSRIGVKP